MCFRKPISKLMRLLPLCDCCTFLPSSDDAKRRERREDGSILRPSALVSGALYHHRGSTQANPHPREPTRERLRNQAQRGRATIRWYNIIQYNTIQYNTIQYNTIQYNTIQYNTIVVQDKLTQCNTIAVQDKSLYTTILFLAALTSTT